MQQYVLRNTDKKFLLSEANNGECINKRTYLMRNLESSKNFTSQDPLPRHALTRKVTIELVECKGSMLIVPNYDCRCTNRENQKYRHAKHIINEMLTLEYFHPRCFKSCSQFKFKN